MARLGMETNLFPSLLTAEILAGSIRVLFNKLVSSDYSLYRKSQKIILTIGTSSNVREIAIIHHLFRQVE